MAEIKITEKMTGWFDVRIFNDRKPRQEWKLKGEDENIAFTMTTENAGEFATFAKPYEKDNRTYYRVTFKISPKTKWYDGLARQTEKPLNADLDGVRYEVRIQYRELLPTPGNDKSPRGYWANSIQFERVEENPFAAFSPSAAALAAEVADPAEMFQDTNDNGGDAELPY